VNDLTLGGLSINLLILVLPVNKVLKVGQHIDKAVHEQRIELAGILVYKNNTE
jgi:hypothetical protein